MSKEKLCILCGKLISESSSSDSDICVDCDKNTAEARYLKHLFI